MDSADYAAKKSTNIFPPCIHFLGMFSHKASAYLSFFYLNFGYMESCLKVIKSTYSAPLELIRQQ